MATNVTLNGVTYPVPAVGDEYGTELSNYLIAIATGLLSKAGGTFILTADANFGNSFGLISAYFTSVGSNPASSGVVRLANTEAISWRNAADSANIDLDVDGSDQLTFAGAAIANSSGKILRAAIAAATANYVLINDGSGNLSQEATLAKSRGGTGADNSSVTFPSSGTLVTRTATETLTNKTITTPTLDAGVLIAEIASPSTPAAGLVNLYAKSDSNLYFKNDAGTENQINIGASIGREGPSATAISLTASSYEDVYLASPASAINQDLPTTNVVEGKKFRIIVTGATPTNTVTVRSSGGNTIDLIAGSGYLYVQALQDAPTTAAHWNILEYQELITHSLTVENSASSGDNTSVNVALRRWTGGNIQADIPTVSVALSGGVGFLQGTSGTAFPSRFRPATRRDYAVFVSDNGAAQNAPGRWAMQTNGQPTIVKTPTSTNFTNGAAAGLTQGIVINYSST